MSNAFAKLFETEHGQLLVTRSFDDMDHADAPYRLTARGEAVGGIEANIEFGFEDEVGQKTAFDDISQGSADTLASSIRKTLLKFGADHE